MKQVRKNFFIHIHTIEYNTRDYDDIFCLIEQLIFQEYLRVWNLVLVHLWMMFLELQRLEKLANQQNRLIHMERVYEMICLSKMSKCSFDFLA